MPHGLIFNVTQNPFLSRPLGGHRIAHYLREQGWDIEVVDWSNWWTLEELKEFFRSRYSSDTVFCGFGHLFSMWSPVMEEFCSWIKQDYPSVTLISGSAVNPMFASQYIDYYIQGFGELAISELLKYIQGNGTRPIVNLITGRKIISAIHNYPAFPMKSLMVKYQTRDYITSDEWLTVELSRGCRFKCAFCNFPVLGVKEDYSRDADDFELQLRDAHDRFGIGSYMVADETFNDRTDKIRKFANVIDKLDFVPWFSGYIRADLLVTRPKDKDELLRMNFLGHYYGIESMNTRSARAIGKGMDSNRLKSGLIDIKKYFETHGSKRYRGSMGLIVGLPHETKQTMDHTMSWLIDNWQGHSFSVHSLILPRNNDINQKSLMSADLSKYGYEEMSEEECNRYEQKSVKLNYNSMTPSMRKVVIDEINWKNKNMNIFDANQITSDIFSSKHNYDFRPSCFALSYKLNKTVNITDRLDLEYAKFDAQLNYSIDEYKNKKLNTQ
jgi:hypothetical protein